MYRGTTPTITINCDIDVSEFVTMWVTFRTQQLATYAPPKQVEVTKHLGDEGAHAPADAEKNVQSDWNETDGNSDAFIKNKPAIPKAVTKTVQTLSDAASKSFTVTGYILSVILIDSATKEQVIGDVSFENATASANGKVTVTLAAAPSNPILVIITSIAL